MEGPVGVERMSVPWSLWVKAESSATEVQGEVQARRGGARWKEEEE